MSAKSRLLRLAEHLREYLLLYVILSIVIALPIGYYNAGFFKTHKPVVKEIILTLAILTLYPSMVQLKSEKFGSELKSKVKETIVALIIIFIIAPLTAMYLAGFITHKSVAIGFVAANSVPASSASIAYVLLAEGNIEFATLLAVISIIGALFTVPAYIGWFARSVAVNVPLKVLGESVGLALLTPYILGQLTRIYIIKMRARKILKQKNGGFPCTRERVIEGNRISIAEIMSHIEDALECIEGKLGKAVKPYLSLSTMITMLILIGFLIANKAYLLIEKPGIALQIIGFQLVIYAVVIASLIAVTLLLRLTYEDHMGMAFISITKNESVAAAVSVMAIGSAAAIPAALVPAIQPVIAILYLAAAPLIRRIARK
ncbi:MAG: bile acid:sodium symporter [Desulfurococcales archaeon]|nr:bile acid:sodium symporter [Desulfurococcales archaeon]